MENCLLLTKTDDVVTLSSTKNKDMDGFTPVALRLTPVAGTDSCVVRLASSVIRGDMLSPSQQAALMALWDTFGTEGATAKEWHAALPGMVERTCFAARKALLDAGYVSPQGTDSSPGGGHERHCKGTARPTAKRRGLSAKPLQRKQARIHWDCKHCKATAKRARMQ